MYKLEKTFTSETRPGLRLNFNSENVGIKIKGSQAEKSVLDVKIDYNTRSKEEIAITDILKLDYNSENNEMRIDISEPKDLKIFKAKLELTVPETTQVSAESENGPIALAGLQGDQILKTENGPLSILDIVGNIQCHGENGPVEINQLQGDVGIEVENGAIRIREAAGNCQIKGENGIIKIKASSGSLNIANINGQIRILESDYNAAEIKNHNGAVYYEFNPLEEGNFNFSNQNGKISLIAPEDIQCDLTAENRLGKINIGIDGNYDKQKVDGRTRIHLIKESGRVKIRAANENGSIIFSSRGKKTDRKFNFNGFAGSFDEVMAELPEEEKAKVKKKLEKVKKKLSKIDFDKIETKIEAASRKFEEAFEKEFDSEQTGKIMQKVKINLDKALDKLNTKLEDRDEKSEKTTKNEESKLMILKMLQDGKITSEEAEKLLKAIGE